jgi:hypothetical protein
MTLDEILDLLEDGREQLLDAIEGLSEEQMQQPGVIADWSVKDMLYHLSMWEGELVKLLWQASQGDIPTTVHFSHRSIDATNAAWYAQGKTRPLANVLSDLAAVRKQTTRRVSAFSDNDLNDPQRFSWLDGSLLWERVEADSFGHEEEHTLQIREWRSRENI